MNYATKTGARKSAVSLYKICIDNPRQDSEFDLDSQSPPHFAAENLKSVQSKQHSGNGTGPQTGHINTPSPAAHVSSHAPRPYVLERRKNRNLPPDAASRIAEFQALAHELFRRKEEQRQTISRELHDNIAQVLTAATARINMAREERIPAWLRQELMDLRDELESALDDVRKLARNLRPSLLDHCGFAAALEKHAEAFRDRTRMALEVRIEPAAARFLDGENLTHLFRLTQESLQNIEEHSGANRAWISLRQNDGALHLEIGDDGCGFTADRVAEAQRDGHLGLLGMHERAELLGGRFHCEATPGKGTTIRVIVPPPPRKIRP